MDRLPKVFNSFKKLNATERHFKFVELRPSKTINETERILEDDTFGDITFEGFTGYNINKIGTNVFNKTAVQLEEFYCEKCSLKFQPNYHIQKIIHLIIYLTFKSN